ncbi:MAG: hypothetical protein AAB403_11055, partial [Planctomycetota bacterium]
MDYSALRTLLESGGGWRQHLARGHVRRIILSLMGPTSDRLFLDFSVRKLTQLSERIGDCLGRLTGEQVWARGGESENAVGNL